MGITNITDKRLPSSIRKEKAFKLLISYFFLPMKREDPSEKMMSPGVSEALTHSSFCYIMPLNIVEEFFEGNSLSELIAQEIYLLAGEYYLLNSRW